jgi:hypothetical protein
MIGIIGNILIYLLNFTGLRITGCPVPRIPIPTPYIYRQVVGEISLYFGKKKPAGGGLFG